MNRHFRTHQAWPLDAVFMTGNCSALVREIRLFQKRNQAAGLDLQRHLCCQAPQPSPETTRDQMMNCLHARFADGHVVSGL